ncbi:unnamed protein product [Symbiodinium microadriaticum]|nr:unnamed protein product [Symbiodinium microadriaticum]CAE7911147.1 unnamed protein product [Symbiodinium sp. KB8]
MASADGSLGNNAGGGKVRSDMSDVPEGFVLPSGDAQKGHKLFKKHCAQCHSVFPDNRTDSGTVYGPTLFNIYGRASGEAEIAQKNIMGGRAKGLIWDDANLMRYMKNPRQTTGVNVQMNFRGIDDFQTRVDIVHYLKTLTLGHILERVQGFGFGVPGFRV